MNRRARSAVPFALLAALAAACAPAPEPPVVAPGLSPGEGRIAVEGGEVSYEIVGSGSATPVLALHGGPGSTSSEIFEDSSHMTMLEQPDEYLRVLRGFLADVDAGGGAAQ